MSAHPTPAPLTWRHWLPDAGFGLLVAVAGLAETVRDLPSDLRAHYVLIALAVGIAVGLSRRAPGAALTIVWVVGLGQVLRPEPVMLTESAIIVVAFGAARWGSTITVWLSGLSIPVAGALAVVSSDYDTFRRFYAFGSYRTLVGVGYRLNHTEVIGYGLLGALVLMAPWLLGLVLRFVARAQTSRQRQLVAEQDAARAVASEGQVREIAELREEQTRLARDVHDVVGHSLAVILAQAESAQYLPDDDPEALKRTMATIATSARTSLQDVRQVLATTRGESPVPPRPGGLDDLVAGVRASGHEVHTHETGTPQPLPPELEVVAYRVLQEMLTNALKHGRRDQPVSIERQWPEHSWDQSLRIEVRNVTSPESTDHTMPIAAGQGVEGMRRRLESVGGHFDVRRREDPAGPTFTATAWVPVRA